ncbi:carbohydrate ABC transporter permease [Cellulomonas timonensis]|uniref:carbohydrate ABC transporter permease n=1 Tax=Cellulomonas timonensis TaxID=1689271 RepID=UPI0008310A76|nr:sugar ABC transporter permease [Cellulomonas timonensis]
MSYVPAPTLRRLDHRRSVSARRSRTAWFFLAPSLITLALFMVWPMVQSLYFSFTDYNRIQAARWVGLDNYAELLGDSNVWNALGNTALYTAVVTPVTVALALAAALYLNNAMAFRGFTRTALFLPFVVSLGIIGIAFSFLMDPNIGLVSHWLSKIGIVSEQGFLSDPKLAMGTVMVVGVWKNVGFYMVMYLAGLQSIPEELHEASRLDGANTFQRFRNVTWPLLSNQTMLICILAATASLQAFDQIFVMTHGGPYFKTETLVMLIYRSGFSELRLGYGAAISWVLMLLVFALSMIQVGYFRKKAVTY